MTLIVSLGAAATLCLLCCGGIVALLVGPKIARSRLNEKLNAEVSASLADSPDRPEWTADAQAVARLGPEVAFAQYAMRLPIGFTPAPGAAALENLDVPGGGKARRWNWLGPTVNGRRAVITAEVREPPANMDGPTYFEQELPWEVRSVRDRHSVHVIEAGRIGGKRAVRLAYHMAKGSIEFIEIHRVDEHREVVVTIACTSVDQAEFFAPMQAAQLTVREITGSDQPLPVSSTAPLPAAEPQTAAISSEGETAVFGGGSDPVFQELAPAGGLLIGLEVGTEPGFGSEIVKTVRPIFRTASGDEVLGQQHGADPKTSTTAKAKEGYAVGGIIVKAGLLVDGLSIVFMRVTGGKLDPNDSYESVWFGGTGGRPKTKLGGSGKPVVGIIGRAKDKHCTGIGLLMKP